MSLLHLGLLALAVDLLGTKSKAGRWAGGVGIRARARVCVYRRVSLLARVGFRQVFVEPERAEFVELINSPVVACRPTWC